ncbi:hypothetical protein L596_002699 [Steinernema carpocapsae]|uniref:Arf-GAP domain-containing protein n=1 Tax=Steinernema carpocapsae TaxID=34508 RepID=A0A4U8UQ02_STECR|nr:hypothetical protein L596_002699 [Steinernema carpocapsae]
MRTIQQEGVNRDKDDDWEVVEEDRFGSAKLTSEVKTDDFFSSFEPKTVDVPRQSSSRVSKPYVSSTQAPSEDLSKKFANAKAISSDQFFGNSSSDNETKSSLARFEGSTGIGSSDLFGGGSNAQDSSYSSQVPDMTDIKDSVRAGASKVAGKLSSISSSLSSYWAD